jgi:DNA-binding IscR family transcriptional regulator
MNSHGKQTKADPIGFTFLTNYSHVLALIARKPDVRMNEIATRLGVTERAVQRIVNELATAGYLTVVRDGRRNRYSIVPGMPLRHPVEGHITIGSLIEVIKPGPGKQRQSDEENIESSDSGSKQ